MPSYLEPPPRPCAHSWILPNYYSNPRRGPADTPGFCLDFWSPRRGAAGIPGFCQAIFGSPWTLPSYFWSTRRGPAVIHRVCKAIFGILAETLRASLDFAKLFLEASPRPCGHSWILPSYFWSPRRGPASIPRFCKAIFGALRAFLAFANLLFESPSRTLLDFA